MSSTRDQLTLEKNAPNSTLFQNFEEGSLDFPPTYKYLIGNKTDLYYNFDDINIKKSSLVNCYEKLERAPAWCDRILWKVSPPLISCPNIPRQHQHGMYEVPTVVLKTYTSIDKFCGSDHKPVVASFHCNLRGVNFSCLPKATV